MHFAQASLDALNDRLPEALPMNRFRPKYVLLGWREKNSFFSLVVWDNAMMRSSFRMQCSDEPWNDFLWKHSVTILSYITARESPPWISLTLFKTIGILELAPWYISDILCSIVVKGCDAFAEDFWCKFKIGGTGANFLGVKLCSRCKVRPRSCE